MLEGIQRVWAVSRWTEMETKKIARTGSQCLTEMEKSGSFGPTGGLKLGGASAQLDLSEALDGFCGLGFHLCPATSLPTPR